jgi:NAD(P)-dependent dehydrogenase (short-subunit alcohol dehydrogenase family)
MAKRLEGRLVLVSGAASGLGQAFAKRLAEDGADVAIADLGPADETEEAIRAAGTEAASFRCDVSDPDSVREVGEAVARDFGRIDVLVNNAGIYPYQDWPDITWEDWRRVLSINLDSMFLMSKAFVPAMEEAGWGRVINLTTGSCFLPNRQMTHYISSKMGVIGFTRALATEVAHAGVTVNAIAPSLVRTPGTLSDTAEEEFQAVADAQPIKRVQMPEDLVGTLSFLASDDAAFITGQTFSVDGGLVRL